MLLTNDHCMGKTSFEDMLRVGGVVHPTYQSVCTALGLLQDDNEWHIALADAAVSSMPQQMRELFVSILLWCAPTDPPALFSAHVTDMWDDFQRDHPTASSQTLHDLVVLDLEERLQAEGRDDVRAAQLPELSSARRAELRQSVATSEFDGFARSVREQLDHDREALQREVDRRLVGPNGKYQPAQLQFHLDVMRAVDDPTEPVRLFNLDAPAGTGKTYIENGLISHARLGHLAVVLAVAISGIASTLMSKAATFHSRFKAPLIGLESNTVFNINRGTKEATLLKMAKLIIWDEVSMGHRHLLEALDRTLRDICHEPNLPFAGKVVVLCGDFRQVLPVVPRASRAGIVRACLKKSSLWPMFKTYTLTENMRILANGEDMALAQWDARLMRIGDGTEPTIADTDYILLPPSMTMEIDATTSESLDASRAQAIDWVFPHLAAEAERFDDEDTRADYCAYLSGRAILAPTNNAVDELNAACMGELQTEEQVFLSADTVINDDQAAEFPVEFLNSMRTSGMPPHRLGLKPGCPLMLLRNLSKKIGLCNGTRLIFLGRAGVSGFLLKCRILSGEHKGNIVLIPRILTQPSDMRGQPCEWRRLQFPVRPAFAMSINKSQGQTLTRAIVWLESSVFGHGQLYVAGSRVGHPDHILFAIGKSEDDSLPANATRNVVYREVLAI
jgi:hypothetical protein